MKKAKLCQESLFEDIPIDCINTIISFFDGFEDMLNLLFTCKRIYWGYEMLINNQLRDLPMIEKLPLMFKRESLYIRVKSSYSFRRDPIVVFYKATKKNKVFFELLHDYNERNKERLYGYADICPKDYFNMTFIENCKRIEDGVGVNENFEASDEYIETLTLATNDKDTKMNEDAFYILCDCKSGF